MTQEKILDKAKKLHKMQESAAKIGSEEEAQAFAAALQNLLARHNLEMSDLQWEEEVAKVATKNWHSKPVKRVATWAMLLGKAVADGNNCRILIYGGRALQFIGTESAVAICVETMDYLYPAADKIAQREYDKRYNALYENGMPTFSMKGYKGSFLAGFVTRLQEHFAEEAARMMAQYGAGTGLMRINQSLRLADNYLSSIKTTKSSRQTAHRGNSQGYADGKRMANDVNIGGAKLSNPTNRLSN